MLQKFFQSQTHSILIEKYFIFTIVIFLIFALTEEFIPGFFTFYISQWFFILPVIILGILYFFSENNEENNRENISENESVFLKIVIFITMQVVFSLIFYLKFEKISYFLWLVLFILFNIIFFIFQWSLLFPKIKIDKVLLFKIVKYLFLISLFFSLLLLFLWYIINPFSFFSFIKGIENLVFSF